MSSSVAASPVGGCVSARKALGTNSGAPESVGSIGNSPDMASKLSGMCSACYSTEDLNGARASVSNYASL